MKNLRIKNMEESEIKDTALILGSGIENIFAFGTVYFHGTRAWNV